MGFALTRTFTRHLSGITTNSQRHHHEPPAIFTASPQRIHNELAANSQRIHAEPHSELYPWSSVQLFRASHVSGPASLGPTRGEAYS